MYIYNLCIELENDIFNMTELLASDKTLCIYFHQIYIAQVVCFQNVCESLANFRDENCLCLVRPRSPQRLDMFQPLLDSIKIRIEV